MIRIHGLQRGQTAASQCLLLYQAFICKVFLFRMCLNTQRPGGKPHKLPKHTKTIASFPQVPTWLSSAVRGFTLSCSAFLTTVVNT